MNDADRATDAIEQSTTVILANRQHEQELAQATPSASECTSCNEPIPSERQIAVPGCQHCTYCANQLELTKR